MNARERLLAVQAALEARGVKDVKFFFSVMSEKPLSQVVTEVTQALQAFLDDQVQPLPAFDDLPA
jgi:hypothetical protein